MPGQKYYYRDFVTEKTHWTQARFIGWHGPDGPLQAMYAMFQRPSHEILFVPEYLLTAQTRALLPTQQNQKTLSS